MNTMNVKAYKVIPNVQLASYHVGYVPDPAEIYENPQYRKILKNSTINRQIYAI